MNISLLRRNARSNTSTIEAVVYTRFAADTVTSAHRFLLVVYGKQKDDSIELEMPDSTVTAVRMRFPANREFEFQISYTQDTVDGREDVVEVRS